MKIFTVCVRSVLLYHFKVVYVVLHMVVKEFLKSTSKNGEIGCFNLNFSHAKGVGGRGGKSTPQKFFLRNFG